MANPTYTTRDSATARLRKLEVGRAEYHKYIEFNDGKFTVRLDLVEKDAAKKSASILIGTTHPTKPLRAQRAERPNSIAGVARTMIRDGKTNTEVWRELCKQFPNLTERHKHYPAWYRSEMKRRDKRGG